MGHMGQSPMGQRDHQQTFLFLRKVANLTNPLNSARGRFCFAVSSPSMTDLRCDKSMNLSTIRTVMHAASHGHISVLRQRALITSTRA